MSVFAYSELSCLIDCVAYCLLCSNVTQLELLHKDPFLTSAPYVSPILPPTPDVLPSSLYWLLFYIVWHVFGIPGISVWLAHRWSKWSVYVSEVQWEVLILFSIVIIVVIIIVTWKYFSTALSQYSHFILVLFLFPRVCLCNSGLCVFMYSCWFHNKPCAAQPTL